MSIQLFLWTEGTLSFRKFKPSLRVNIHWALNGTATILALFGFLSVYKHKENEKATHFESYHSIAGAATLLLLLVQTFGGNFLVFRKAVSFIPKGLLKWGHRISGIISITAIYVTLFLELSWFISVLLLYPYVQTLNKFFNAHLLVKAKSRDMPKKKKQCRNNSKNDKLL